MAIDYKARTVMIQLFCGFISQGIVVRAIPALQDLLFFFAG